MKTYPQLFRIYSADVFGSPRVLVAIFKLFRGYYNRAKKTFRNRFIEGLPLASLALIRQIREKYLCLQP